VEVSLDEMMDAFGDFNQTGTNAPDVSQTPALHQSLGGIGCR
jgi:hypothetical protein